MAVGHDKGGLVGGTFSLFFPHDNLPWDDGEAARKAAVSGGGIDVATQAYTHPSRAVSRRGVVKGEKLSNRGEIRRGDKTIAQEKPRAAILLEKNIRVSVADQVRCSRSSALRSRLRQKAGVAAFARRRV